VRSPLNFLRQIGVLQYSLIFIFLISIAFILTIMIKRHIHEWWRYSVLITIFVSYYLIAKKLPQPEEQIHLLEYGLVGVFFVRALELSINKKVTCYFLALLFASLAGYIDELIQGVLPSRYYDNRDVLLNIVSSLLGLILFSAITFRPSLSKSNPKL